MPCVKRRNERSSLLKPICSSWSVLSNATRRQSKSVSSSASTGPLYRASIQSSSTKLSLSSSLPRLKVLWNRVTSRSVWHPNRSTRSSKSNSSSRNPKQCRQQIPQTTLEVLAVSRQLELEEGITTWIEYEYLLGQMCNYAPVLTKLLYFFLYFYYWI